MTDQFKKNKSRSGLIIAFIVVIIIAFVAGAVTSAYVVAPRLQGIVKNNEPEKVVGVKENLTTEEKETIVEQAEEPTILSFEYENPVVGIVEKIGTGVVSVRSQATLLPSYAADGTSSFGSGFIISKDGYIVTNNHVIENGKFFTAIMSDGVEHEAKLIGGDPYRDIAVLKIEADNLTVVPIGDSDAVKVGQLAIAIGNPLGQGLGGTVTVGYISAVHRQVEGNEYLQTDAAINPGNSGGPLVNVNGQVVGINALKNYLAGIDEAGIPIATEGIGFAIPINDAMDVANELIDTGEVKRPGIGIQFYPITKEMAEENDVPVGAYVVAVTEGGPADVAGIKPEDIIIGLNGVIIKDGDKLPKLVQALDIGKEATFKLWRAGETLDVTLIIGNLSKMNE